MKILEVNKIWGDEICKKLCQHYNNGDNKAMIQRAESRNKVTCKQLALKYAKAIHEQCF